MARDVRFAPSEMLQPLHHCACGFIELEFGYRVTCVAFLAWAAWGFVAACKDAGRGEGVWMESFTYNTTGLAAWRIVSFLYSVVHQSIGLYAHAKRDATKADIYFWGWVFYTGFCFMIDVMRLSTIEADSQSHSDGECNRCMEMVNATSCNDESVLNCMVFSASAFKPLAYSYGLASLVTALGINLYFSLVARSYWFYLCDDRLSLLGTSEEDCLTPLEQQATPKPEHKPETRNPTPQTPTLHPTPYTLHPTPYTLQPEPTRFLVLGSEGAGMNPTAIVLPPGPTATLNPKPQTLNPKP
ncbi:hypothetical protein T484DRAFT_1892357 [Baffinella frigidus]|nr:hypothetical protein T484DRAFT_1892357 [Cryptophyta sp. CCMP2293]